MQWSEPHICLVRLRRPQMALNGLPHKTGWRHGFSGARSCCELDREQACLDTADGALGVLRDVCSGAFHDDVSVLVCLLCARHGLACMVHIPEPVLQRQVVLVLLWLAPTPHAEAYSSTTPHLHELQ